MARRLATPLIVLVCVLGACMAVFVLRTGPADADPLPCVFVSDTNPSFYVEVCPPGWITTTTTVPVTTTTTIG